MIPILEKGPPVSFETFIDARLRSLVKLAMVLCGSRPVAEDVVQEVLLRAHQQWNRIGSLDSPYGYVRTMIVHEHLSWRRRTRRLVSVAEPERSPIADHAEHTANRDDLIRRIDALPAQQRAAVVLRFYADLDDAEIAATLGCSTGAVRSYISRGLSNLRVQLGPSADGTEF